ncbi:MAG: GrdX family protein [Halarsenatibacteraceae bacterium]
MAQNNEKVLTIITNNPRVKSAAILTEHTTLFFSDLNKVLIKARDLIHQGYTLITHPLAGSVKPWANPFRTIVLEEGDQLNMRSLEIMESSLQKYNQFKKDLEENFSENLNEAVKKDYQLIDYDLIKELI